MSKAVVVQQIHRKDILENMLSNISLSGKELFELIVKEKFNKKPCTESRQGFLFEAVCEILISLKCVENLNYTEINNGQLQSLKKVNNIIDLLKENVSKGSNLVDMTIKQNGTLIPFTIKYKSYYDKNLKKKNSETDVSKIDNTIVKQNISDDYKIGLIVKDKEMVLNHRYKNKMNIDKQLHNKIIENGLLFDEKDIIKALDVFCQRFSDNVLSLKKFIEFINKEYLSSSRQQLTKKLHQKMTELKFIGSFSKGSKKFCIAHKPRSGKSITILSISKYLLENGYKKILVMTSVPATIDSFIGDLEKYIDFTNISYKLQEEFGTIDENFSGLVFCSVQYLKTNVKVKKNLLKKIGFEAIIIDESHQGSSTNKTKAEILDVDTDVEDIRETIKLNIFASGTADKTKKYYRIPNSCVYEWEIEDEAFMKELNKLNNPDVNKKEILEYMVSRHGNTFTECFEDETLNQDYSKYPTQVLMKYSIPNSLVDEIKRYNMVNGTNLGYSCSSLFALKQTINKKGEVKYVEEFELCQTNDGEEILKGFFQFIISNNKNDKTMMKEIEMTQTWRNSRKSTKENPLLFIVYLPTHTGNNTISLLQKTIKAFLEKHKLWEHYTIEYSNSLEDSGNVKEEYNEYIQTIMDKTKKSKKIGCILLLGNKGSVGITYSDCDVTISLDDGHNLDNQKQRFSRALTEAEGKTIGINIDMNIQRTYLYLIELIQKHRRNTKTTKTNAEILYYLFEHNIFLFDPQNFKNGKIKMVDILSYFEREVEKIMKEIDDTPFLEELICDDTMREFILTDFQKGSVKKINGDIQGEQLDCPKGDKTKTEIDGPEGHSLVEKEKEKMEILINQTLEMCKSFLFPLLALISKSYNIFDFKDIFTDEKTSELIVSLLKDKKIDLERNNYIIIKNIMNTIIDNNSEIVNNIREIYKIASADKIRELIEKHFIPTNDEKKQNAEVPTPVKLVDEMLNAVPVEYWKTPRKVFEPCCGKGNFVLGIFDKFYTGLEELYPDKIERCRVIMKECIYYADLTAMNVFITTEIMKCHVQSYCKLEQLDFEFNHYTGDTLELDVCKKWTNGFEAVVGNPPYNSSGNTATGNTIWQDFTKKSLNKWLLPNGYLLFVHPPGWRKPNTERGKFTKMFDLMTKQNQMIYLEIHGIKDGQKVFNCGTRYDWYLVEKKRRYKNTIVIDEEGKKNVVELGELSWLPNSNILEINKILARDGDEKCPIMYDRTAYGADKKDRVSSVETKEFKYPCIHTTPKSGIRYMYSKVNNRGHFGVSKVIFGDSGIYKPVIDMDGKYGMTQHSMAIMVDNLEEANNICKAINSDKFDNIIKSCLFSSYAIDWNIFREFKKDFWKGYI
jgi:hypothetical protein